MNAVFADTSFYVALLSPSDVWHSKAPQISDQLDGPVVTTEYVLIELGNALSRRRDRALFLEFLRYLEHDEGTEILPASKILFRRGLSLFARHTDKD
jgi:uncharacterized protein